MISRVLRPAEPGQPAFNLAYVRSGPSSSTPAIIIPGGPGLASILPYHALRRQCAADGLDVIMVEHRGVGFSRKDRTGRDLPQSAMWVMSVVRDIAAVLDQEGVRKAFLAGSSYGTFIASAVAATYPDRVAGMLLDSALQSTAYLNIERKVIRRLFWHPSSRVAVPVRTLVEGGDDQRVLLDVIRAAYELSGMNLVEEVVTRRAQGRANPAWDVLAVYATRSASLVGIPYWYEFTRAGAIGFRELDYAPPLDGRPLDPALTYSELQPAFPAFVGQPYDLPALTGTFNWPLGLLVGDRDVRTPPEIAYRTARLAPRSAVATISNGHSALDTHPLAFAKALKLLANGQVERLPQVADALDALPRTGPGALLARTVERIAGL